MSEENDQPFKFVECSKSKQKQKFDEIKQKAWDFYKTMHTVAPPRDLRNMPAEQMLEGMMEISWRNAKRFCDFTKQKEEEMNDEN